MELGLCSTVRLKCTAYNATPAILDSGSPREAFFNVRFSYLTRLLFRVATYVWDIQTDRKGRNRLLNGSQKVDIFAKRTGVRLWIIRM